MTGKGRSPYEPLDTLQRSSSPSSPPPTTQEPDENVEYIQLYDQRGHPQNPRSRALAKALRNAQNDVLSAIGVVERKELHARLLQKAEREKLEARRKDNEETHAIWLSFVSGVVTEVLTAPVEVLKQRLLVRHTCVSLTKVMCLQFTKRFLLYLQAMACLTSVLVYTTQVVCHAACIRLAWTVCIP